ncbi:MAG TPA: phage holin family protein [Actinomycetota bacterium]|nr:phage holin family protein [Actinomycetota bacterium]
MTQENRPSETLTEIVKSLSADTAEIVRIEVQRATADLAARAKAGGVGAGLLAGAGVLGAGAFASGTQALVQALSRYMPRGAAALLVAAVYAAGAAQLAVIGRRRLQAASPSALQDVAKDVVGDLSGEPRT